MRGHSQDHQPKKEEAKSSVESGILRESRDRKKEKRRPIEGESFRTADTDGVRKLG